MVTITLQSYFVNVPLHYMKEVKALIRYYTYYLALQKCNMYSDYTIHGLWIDYTRGGYPQFCNAEPFDVEKLTSILPQMKEVWPSCYGDSGAFWEHEWKKHATCFPDAMSVVDYFNTTLQLYYTHSRNCARYLGTSDCMILVDPTELN